MPLNIGDRKDAQGNGNSASPASVAVSSITGAGAISSVAAFTATVYPIVTAHCNSCHSSTNLPFFATANAQNSHDALVTAGKVNLDNPALSRMVLRLSADMHNCWTNCAANATEMQNAIASWKTKITPVVTATSTTTATTTGTSTATSTAVTPAARLNTIELLVPATLAGPGEAAANFTTLTFPLSSAADTIVPDVTAANFTIEIQKFDAFSYRIRNPKVISPNTAVYLSDIRVAVNGVIRANDTTYTLVNQLVAMGTGGTVVSPASMVILLDKGAGVDKIALSFAAIRASAAAGCKNLATFQASVKPVMTNSCIRCHNAGNSYDMVTGTDANICARTLGRIDTAIPANSALIVKPLLGTGHSGGGNLINQTTANSWVTWITSER
ncbi:MAG: hypothetical protein ACXWQO_06370 [Bdellovibrionota bacterium]